MAPLAPPGYAYVRHSHETETKSKTIYAYVVETTWK